MKHIIKSFTIFRNADYVMIAVSLLMLGSGANAWAQDADEALGIDQKGRVSVGAEGLTVKGNTVAEKELRVKGVLTVENSLTVNGDLTAKRVTIEGELKAQKFMNEVNKAIVSATQVVQLQCQGERYQCQTANQCSNLCIQKGGRIAYRHEVFEIALRGKNHCAAGWYWNMVKNEYQAGYPMYNYSGKNCGNTSNTPIITNWGIRPANCFCKL
jgi:cytoskeletal protein CcmA (bactofilin family)